MTLDPHTAAEYTGALTFIGGEIDALPATVYGNGAADQVRTRRSQLARVRVMLSSGRAASEALDGIAALCGCNRGPDTDGPEQDCPVHGDGTSFVQLCRFRDTVVALAHALIGAVLDQRPDVATDLGAPFDALRITLETGPWASSTDVATVSAGQGGPAPVADDYVQQFGGPDLDADPVWGDGPRDPEGDVWGPAATGPRGF